MTGSPPHRRAPLAGTQDCPQHVAAGLDAPPTSGDGAAHGAVRHGAVRHGATTPVVVA